MELILSDISLFLKQKHLLNISSSFRFFYKIPHFFFYKQLATVTALSVYTVSSLNLIDRQRERLLLCKLWICLSIYKVQLAALLMVSLQHKMDYATW